MIVTRENFHAVLADIALHPAIGIDTETTGLHWWRHRLFSIIITTPAQGYYFNFNPNGPMLTRHHLADLSKVITKKRTHYGSNAKFDMHMLANEGIWTDDEVDVVDFQSRERLLRNALFPFEKKSNLNNLALHYLGRGKNELVEEYISKHKLYKDVAIPGKKKLHRDKNYAAVPFALTSQYGLVDGDLHLGVGTRQSAQLAEKAVLFGGGSGHGYGDLYAVDENERRLLRTCFRMEREGIKIDVDYTKRAQAYEESNVAHLKKEFAALTGSDYSDSEKCFVPVFQRLGLSYPTTAKGNPSFAAEALEAVDNPVANLITGIRGKEKQIGTYYSSFLHFRDVHDKVHANIKQWGTEHGRMSYSDPNLQNLPKQEDPEDQELPFHVRGCFIPDDSDYCLVSIDYRQQELRMMLDYAGEHSLISKINDGFDPHEATALETGLTRRIAKIINFGIAYGMGAATLAKRIGCTESEAVEYLKIYYSKMRNVKLLIKQVARTARTRGHIRNWLGRVLTVNDPKHNYVLFNHLISGGCADVCKIAMNLADDKLRRTKSKLLVQVHDELLFKVHKDELDLVPKLQSIMDGVYQSRNGMTMPTSVDHSWKSWSHWDKTKGLPCESNITSRVS